MPTKLVASGSANTSNVNDTNQATTLLAANAARNAASIFNDSTVTLYVKFGASASTTDHKVQIAAGGYFEFPQPVYTGLVTGIWSADASGAARISEEVA